MPLQIFQGPPIPYTAMIFESSIVSMKVGIKIYVFYT